MKTIAELAVALSKNETTAEKLTAQCLEKIADPQGEGERAFIKVYAESARAAARASDTLRRHGVVASPLAGIPISIKDLFDVQGDVTRAGSIILRNAPPAITDAPAIARLRAAGAVIIGRTNMTEFAYGGHGINAHYGTPLNPWDRAAKRIPGGSTSGGAVSVTDGMAFATIGSDTGGSVRIPAAACGIVGFKPTQSRVPLTGAFPLSFTRDSIGPLGASAACCALLDHIMTGEPGLPEIVPLPLPLRGLRFGVPTTVLLDGLSAEVASAFQKALEKISAAGGVIEEFKFPELAEEIEGSKKANFSAVEAYALHRENLARQLDQFDPMVAKRLLLGANMSAADYCDLILLRQKLIASANRTTMRFDALLSPTLPIVAPTIAEMQTSDEHFYRINALLLRNCAPFNVLNRPAWSLPIYHNKHDQKNAPVGLQIIGETMGDTRLQAIGLAVEAALKNT